MINSPYLNLKYFSFQQFFGVWSQANKGGFSYYFLPFDIGVSTLMRVMPQSYVIEFTDAIVLFIALISSFKLCKYISSSTKIGLVGAFVYSYSIFGQFMSNWTNSVRFNYFFTGPIIFLFFSVGRRKNEFY